MDKNELLPLFTRQQRIEVTFPDFRREADGKIIRQASTSGEEGFVLYSNLLEGEVEEAIAGQIAYFERLGQDFEWKVYDYDQPVDLKERLRAHGFEIGEPEAVMVLDLAEAPVVLVRTVPPEVRRVTRPEGVDELVTLEEEVWQEDFSGLGQRLRKDLRENPDELSIYLAAIDGKTASAGWIYFHPGTGFASLWGGSTLPQYRKLGLYTSLLAARAQEAWQRGFRFLTVDASPMSRPILERHGFQLLAFAYACKWHVKPGARRE
jgi:hypothetical protein